MLWINYLDTGSERVHTSLEGSYGKERLEKSGGGGRVQKRWFLGKIHWHSSLLKSSVAFCTNATHEGEQTGRQIKIKVVFTFVFSFFYLFFLFVEGELTSKPFVSGTPRLTFTQARAFTPGSCPDQPQICAAVC